LLHQQLHNGPALGFGRATKIVGLGIDVPVGQQIVLRNTTPPQDILSLTVAAGDLVEIFINNTDNLPPGTPYNPRADFFNYYKVLKVSLDGQPDNQPDAQPDNHYEFWDLTDPETQPAILSSRAVPAAGTVCPGGTGAPGPLCGMAFLSQYSGPLS